MPDSLPLDLFQPIAIRDLVIDRINADGRINAGQMFDREDAEQTMLRMPAAFVNVGVADFQNPQTWGQVTQEGYVEIEIILVADGTRTRYGGDREAAEMLKVLVELLLGFEVLPGAKVFIRRWDNYTTEDLSKAGFVVSCAAPVVLISSIF